MLKRQTTGSVVCASCGTLVGVQDDQCLNCGRRNPGLWGYAPALRRLGQDLGFVQIVLWGCGALYVGSLLLSGTAIRMDGLFRLLSPSLPVLFLFGASGAVPVFGFGRWWTVLSAAWLHGSLLHILFNLYWVRLFAPPTADIYGPGRMVIIYTVSSITGFTLSTLAGQFLAGMPIWFLQGAQFTIGASAPLFGLLGALVYYGRRSGSRQVQSQALTYVLIFTIFGVLMPGIDNYAHAGGFAGGYVTARMLDPLRPERIDHLLIALVCLGLTALSLVASLLHGLPLFR
jgi:rhomboid protease GluP